ncbi:MAG TPA: hypothetical protein VIM84_03640 [Gemmatimonadales bacterium]
MTIFEPRHASTVTLISAVRELDAAGVIECQEFVRQMPSHFVLRNAEGHERRPVNREVPAYLVGQYDLMVAVRGAVPDLIAEAFADPSVVDRETLGEAIMARLDVRFGAPVRTAASHFVPVEQRSEETMAVAS